jgi:predicted ATPase
MVLPARMRSFLLHLEVSEEKVKDWSAYPFSIPAVARMGRLDLSAPVTFFVGENGSGKSTLIEAIAERTGFGGEGGTKNLRDSLRPSESCLRDFVRVARGVRRETMGFFLRAETMFNFSTSAEKFPDFGWAKLHEMSHGEAFLWVMKNKFKDGGLFILDEPEAALSPQRQLALLLRIRQLVNAGSQFIISTHSPILLAYPNATIYVLGPDGIRRTPYEDTEHYVVTRAFLQDPAGRIKQLFEEE